MFVADGSAAATLNSTPPQLFGAVGAGWLVAFRSEGIDLPGEQSYPPW